MMGLWIVLFVALGLAMSNELLKDEDMEEDQDDFL